MRIKSLQVELTNALDDLKSNVAELKKHKYTGGIFSWWRNHKTNKSAKKVIELLNKLKANNENISDAKTIRAFTEINTTFQNIDKKNFERNGGWFSKPRKSNTEIQINNAINAWIATNPPLSSPQRLAFCRLDQERRGFYQFDTV